jgi:hypothetical protein
VKDEKLWQAVPYEKIQEAPRRMNPCSLNAQERGGHNGRKEKEKVAVQEYRTPPVNQALGGLRLKKL